LRALIKVRRVLENFLEGNEVKIFQQNYRGKKSKSNKSNSERFFGG